MAGGQIENLIQNELGRAPRRPASNERTPYVDNAPINEILNRYRLVADHDYLDVLNKRTTQRKELFEYLGRNVKTVAKGALYVGIAAAAIGTGYGMFVSHQTPAEVISEGLGLVKEAAAFVGEQFSKVGDKISTSVHGPKNEPGKALFDVAQYERGGSHFQYQGGAVYNAAKDVYESLGVENPHEWAKNFTIDSAAPVIATIGPEGLATTTQHPNVGEWKWAVGALSALGVRSVWNKLRPLQRLGNVWKTLVPQRTYNDLGTYERQELEKLIKRVEKEARFDHNRAQVKRELELALTYHKDKMNALRKWDTQRLGIPEPERQQELAEGEIDFEQVPPAEPDNDNPFRHLLDQDAADQQPPAQAQQPEQQPAQQPAPEQQVQANIAPEMAALLQGMSPDQQRQLAHDLMNMFQQQLAAQQQAAAQQQMQPPVQPVQPPPVPPVPQQRFPDYEDLTRNVVDDIGDAGSVS